MNDQESEARIIRLNRSDAILLAAVTEGSHDGRPVSLPDFLNDYDWLERGLSTFDELSFGVPRLVEAGYVIVGRDSGGHLTLRATPKANALRRSISTTTLGGVIVGAISAVGAAPYPDAEPPEDRSLGRLDGFEAADLAEADRSYRAWFDRTSKPILAAARLISRVRRPRR